jgi:hypothetical protein
MQWGVAYGIALPAPPMDLEEEVTSFVDQGPVGKLPNGQRFHEVVTAVRQANETSLRAVAAPPADAKDGDGAAAPKILISRWTEYTPTGALDLDVVTMPLQAQ